MRLIFVTQLVDPDDPILGYTVETIRHLAERVDQVVVVANEVRAVPPDLDAEVVSLGKERGWGRLRRGARYQVVLGGLTAKVGLTGPGRMRAGTIALLAHMCPTYLVQAAPVARLAGVPCLLWYSHPHASRSLGRAERLAAAVLTALPGSFPRASDKLWVIGQTVDTRTFALAPPLTGDGTLRLLALGRLSPVKNLPVVVQALARARAAGIDARLRIVGPVLPADRAHREELGRLVDGLGLGPYVAIEPPIAHDRAADLIHQATALVCATVGGSADKTVFEAMACGRPVLASNPALAADLAPDVGAGPGPSLHFPEGDDAALAARMVELAGAGPARLETLGATLRVRVEQNHSLDHWAARVVEIAGECAASERARDRRPIGPVSRRRRLRGGPPPA